MTGSIPHALTLNAHSFVPSERIVCRLPPLPNTSPERVTNVSLDFFRIERLRNQFAFGFGTTPRVVNGEIEVEQRLPPGLKAGLYGIGGGVLSFAPDNVTAPPQEVASQDVRVTFPPVVFQVRTVVELPASPETITQQVAIVFDQRSQLARTPHIVGNSLDSPRRRFLVYVFGVGCLLHQTQQLEGFAVLPLGVGFSHANMSNIVNRFLEENAFEPLPVIDTTEQAFAGSTPAFVVTYPVVVAAEADAALEYCRKHADSVFNILGMDRGQKPRAFAFVATEIDTPNWWHRFEFPGYRGNLLSDFNPARTANEIERLIPRLKANPFSRLIVSTYSDATSEQEYGFALLRYWSILELVADRKIVRGAPVLHLDGTQIKNRNGNLETTNSKHGRVYAYILSNGAFEQSGTYTRDGVQRSYHIGHRSNPNVGPATELFALWDIVRAGYAIRNAIAHEGQFDLTAAQSGDAHQQLAARLRVNGNPDPLTFIKSQAQLAVWREV